MGNDGVVLFCDRKVDAARNALDATLAELGYTTSATVAVLEGTWCTAEAGLCLKVELNKAFGIVLARRIARRLGRPVRVFSASLVGEDPIDCAVDDLSVPAEGTPRQGNWGTDLALEHGDDWSGICDGKAYFAVSACLEGAVLSVLGEDHQEETLHLVPPPSLGAPRLDEIAKQVRLADDAHQTVMSGRTCVRIRNAGATVTSFVSATEMDTLRAALGSLLPTK